MKFKRDMALKDWKKKKEISSYKVWENKKNKSINMNVRRNANTGNWQVFVTDGMIELRDLGEYDDKSYAIEEAEEYMRKN